MIKATPYREGSYCTKPCMLGQAGHSLEKQIARSDPPGDHRPAGTRQRAKRTDALRAGGRGRLPPTLQHRCLRQGRRVSIHPVSLAGRSFRWPGNMADRSSGALAGRAKTRALSRAQRRSAADGPALRLRDISARNRARSFAEASKVVPKHLPDPRIRPHRVAAESDLLIFSHYSSEVRRRA